MLVWCTMLLVSAIRMFDNFSALNCLPSIALAHRTEQQQAPPHRTFLTLFMYNYVMDTRLRRTIHESHDTNTIQANYYHVYVGHNTMSRHEPPLHFRLGCAVVPALAVTAGGRPFEAPGAPEDFIPSCGTIWGRSRNVAFQLSLHT
ncbi:hypothetical protein EDB86DRAFT_1529209 [Lactarius hatsudake]|nr:hypothetical protein EDB86DRAFT_1529209 [Lactarius hatsudake]